MPPKPQALFSSSVNPANLVELQVLTNIVAQLQNKGDIRGSIPYLAKIAQIVDNQKLEKPQDPTRKQNYYLQLRELRKVKADAQANLADAYFLTQQFILFESSMLISVKLWENLLQHEPEEREMCCLRLKKAYQQLAQAYESMGKPHLAQHATNKLSKLEV